jgi:SNF2 family DNA or RNA helicase
MLVDEAQHIKELSSARTRRALELGARADRRWVLTGTPVLNDHKELFPLLSLTGHPLAKMGQAKFAKVFKQKRGNQALAKRIGEWLLRRTKDEVLDLGQKRETQIHLRLDAPELFEYNRIFFDKEQTALAKIIGLRRILEEAKLRFIGDAISDLGKADKAIVFCFYKESVRLLCDSLDEQKIKWVSITGADTPKKRLAAEDAFQSDPKARVCVATIDAAYAGLNLTAANYVYFATLPWTPAKKRQAEDRAYRNGQERDVLVVTPIVLDSIDEQLLEMLLYKAMVAKDSTEQEDDNKMEAEFTERVFSEKPKISLASGG